MSKIKTNINFENNPISNVVVESLTTSQINSLPVKKGKVVFDTNEDVLKVGNSSEYEAITAPKSFKNIKVINGGVSTYVNANISTDTLVFEAGDNTSLEANSTTKTIKVVTSGLGSPHYVKYIGDTANVSYDIAHNLNTSNLIVQIWENISYGNLVSADVQVVNPDKIRLRFFSPPANNYYKVIISDKNGTQGPQGSTGATGVQGSVGPQGSTGPAGTGIDFGGTKNYTVRFNQSEELALSSVLQVEEDNVGNFGVNIDGQSIAYPLIVGNHIGNQSNINGGGGIKVMVKNNADRSVTNLLLLTHNGYTETAYNTKMRVDGNGNIFVPYYANISMSEGAILYADKTSGRLSPSTVDITSIEQSVRYKNIEVTLNSSDILNSYSTPIEIIPAVTGKYIVPKHVFAVIVNDDPAIPYTWSGTAGIGYDSNLVSDFIWTLSQNLKGPQVFPYMVQNFPIFNTEGFLNNFFYNDSAQSLYFYTKTQNPSNGTGKLILNIDYSLVDIPTY